PGSADSYSGWSLGTTAASPDEPSAQIAVMRASLSASSSAAVKSATAVGGSGGSRRPSASARYRRTRGSSSLDASNALTSAGASERSARTLGSAISRDSSYAAGHRRLDPPL